jgi:L-lactate dehydrogenase (cytochrome)
LSTRSIEDVASVSSAPLWFQVYVWRDHGLVKELIGRAAQAGYEALVLTVDLPVHGRRLRDVRHGFELPPQLGLGTLVDGALHPGWTWSFVRADPIRFSNLVGSSVGDGGNAMALGDFMHEQLDPDMTWDDLEFIRDAWSGPIVVKGIQTVEDARLAAEFGLDAIAISNHGGRQLDMGRATLDLVAPIVDAVGDQVEIICDGGIRRGSDIVKAVARGARACMSGRAYLYGLAAGGERGVDHALHILRDEMRRTMALLGTARIADLSTEILDER